MVVAGVDADGLDVSTLAVPPLRDEDPDGTAHDNAQPVFVSTISSGDDLTLVLGVEGSVNAAGATTLELDYPDGTATEIALASDGSYRFMIPPDRQSDFATVIGQARRTGRQRSGCCLGVVHFGRQLTTKSVTRTRRPPYGTNTAIEVGRYSWT